MRNTLLTTALSLAFAFTTFAHAGTGTGTVIDHQWAVCDSSPKDVLKKLGEDASTDPDKVQKIAYYDSKHGRYIRDGVTFRTKDRKAKGESSVKIRFSSVTDAQGANCQWDRYGADLRYTCEMLNKRKNDDALWSNKQAAFLAKYYQAVDTNELEEFGPYNNRKWNLQWQGMKVVFDSVDTEEAGHLMEFSLQTAYSQDDAVYADFTAWLISKGIVLCAKQEGKTERLFRAIWPGQN